MNRVLRLLSQRFVGTDCPDEWAARSKRTESVVRKAHAAIALSDAKAQAIRDAYAAIDERLCRP